MGKISLHAPFNGVKDGLTLCTLLLDKKKLKEVMGVIKALEDERVALNEAIEVYGKASQMDVLLRNAGQKDRDAATALNEAKEKAGQIQTDARSWAEKLRVKIVEREDAVTVQEKTLVEGEIRFKADVDAWQIKMVEHETKISGQEKTIAVRLDEARKLKKRLDTALKSMKADVAAA